MLTRRKTPKHVSQLEKEKQRLIGEQFGRCAVCGGEFGFVTGEAVVDYGPDMKTNKIRAVICKHCDQAMILIAYNKDKLVNLWEYLNKWEGEK